MLFTVERNKLNQFNKLNQIVNKNPSKIKPNYFKDYFTHKITKTFLSDFPSTTFDDTVQIQFGACQKWKS